MKTPPFRLLAATVTMAVAASTAAAQQIAYWTNQAGNFNWRVTGNWAWPEATFPNDPAVSAHFSYFSNAVSAGIESRIGITMSGSSFQLNEPGNVDVAAIILEETNTINRLFRNSSTGTADNQRYGFVTIHGTPAEMDGEPVNLLLGNYSVADGTGSDLVTLQFHMNSANQILNVRFANSGVLHTEYEDTRIWFTVPIVEMDEPVTLTKTGPGILQFGINYSATPGRNSTTGGLIMKGGILQSSIGGTTTDGEFNTQPLGFGPVTLMDGVTIRSTSTDIPPSGRTFHNDFFLQGRITIGGTEVPNGGSISLSAAAGRTTTLLSDVTINAITVGNFYQTIVGDYWIIKEGPERLSLFGENNAFVGAIIRDGNLTFNGTDYGSSTLPAYPAELMLNQFIIDGGALRFISFGSTLGANRGITVTENGGAIEVAGTWLMGTNGPIVDANPETPGTLLKTGTGSWTLAASSEVSIKGPFIVEGGRLIVNGLIETSPVEVLEGGRLWGGGVLGGPVTVRTGGELAPGPRTESGMMQAQAPVVLEAGVNTIFRLDSRDSSSRLRAEQGVQFQEVNLAIDLLHQPYGTDTYVLIENAGAPGSLTGLFLYNGTPLQEGDTFLVEQDIDPTDPTLGAYSVEFTITYDYNGGGYQNSVAIVAGGEAPPPPGGAYNAWRIERFGNDTDPAGAPDAQPAGQAVANLMFHALGLDLGADTVSGVPTAVAEGTISFTRRTPLGTRLIVEGADSLTGGSWTELAVLESGADNWTGPATVGEEPAGEGLVRVTITDPNSPATGTRFLRVRAVLP